MSVTGRSNAGMKETSDVDVKFAGKDDQRGSLTVIRDLDISDSLARRRAEDERRGGRGRWGGRGGRRWRRGGGG